MEQASGWHCCCMVPHFTKFVTMVIISHSATQTLQAKTKNHRSRRQAEAKTTNTQFRTTKNHGQTTLEGKTVDFSPFWWIKEPFTADDITIDGRKEKVLFRNLCVDWEVLQMMSHEHPSRSAGKAQEGYLGEEQRMVLRIIFFEW